MLNYSSIERSGWKLIKLGDIATEINERVESPENSELKRFVGLEHISSGELEINKWSSTEGLVSAAKKFEIEDVLFARRNVYLRRASQVSFDGICSGDAFVLRGDKDKIVPGFLTIILNSSVLWEHAIANAAGTMSKRVKWRDLREFSFLLPPKQVQSDISHLIWGGHHSLMKKRELHDAIDILKYSEFKKMCSSENKEKYIPVTKLLLGTPKNGFSPKCNSEGKGIRTVSLSAISRGKFIVKDNVKYAEVEHSILEKFDVKNDDVFIVRGNGNKNLCGRAGISDENHEELFYPDLLIRLRFNQNVILPSFATFQWNTEAVHARLMRVAKSTNGIWKVNGDDVKRHKLLVPSLERQKEIMERLETIDQRRQLCSDAIVQTQKLLSTLINNIL
ncbi:restriction endonuclease subunit S [Vibrio kanaloae]|uniref:restriction endonuclease subunit S n=1 Tax=Vibrio kanaloae TaxID=170673 RepID=UPI0010BDB12D|nr:restriction endonuclease subunit S [Vibrio kanaloae]TKF02568.1 hypothetical protein FCV46_15125 [Vibrio kanaloae]TKF62598.1 hypothetical protein FCV51_07810 [Vibrio kanaloae]